MSKAFCCNALDTPQAYISNKKMSLTRGAKAKRARLAPKRPFWGPRRYSEGNGLPERADIRSKCVVNMSPTQADQSGAVGTKFGLPGPSEGPKRGILGQIGPF